jgi:ribonucleoside-diphosphate reductase alpha chain
MSAENIDILKEFYAVLNPLSIVRDAVNRSRVVLEAKRLKRQELEELVADMDQNLAVAINRYTVALARLERRRPADDRESITHKFHIGGHEGYVTVGKYDDGSPAEIFITMAKEGSTIGGLMDSFASMTTLALQYGVPLQEMVDKFTHTRFEPSGFTKNPNIPMVKSIMDYIFRWMALNFLNAESQKDAGVITKEEVAPASVSEKKEALFRQDAPACSDCGSIMVRNGACYKCLNCGATSGCA